MRLLVTGREGQLVRSMRELSGRQTGTEIVTAARPHVDLAITGSVRQAILAERPDMVVNAAAYTLVDQAEDEPGLARRINAEAAGEAAAASHKLGIPIVQLSTDYVFDGSASAPIDEERSTSPINTYGATKLAGEEAVRRDNAAHVILRTAWVISPFGRNFVTSMLAAAQHRPELRVVADQKGSPTSALDLAAAILRLAEQIKDSRADLLGKTFHLGGRGEASWFELASATMEEAEAAGLPFARVRPIDSSDWPTRARRPAYSVLDSRRFELATGFTMPHWRGSLETIIRRLAEAR